MDTTDHGVRTLCTLFDRTLAQDMGYFVLHWQLG